MKLGSAVLWTLISVGTISVMKLLGNLTLARLLPVDAFGLTAIIFAIVSGIEAITDVGTTPSLIRSQRSDAAWLDTSWSLSLVRGIVVAVVIALLAYPTSVFFNDDRLFPMIAVSSLMSILIGMKSIQAILAVRNLQVRTVALVDLFASVVGYAVMLSWAWYAPSAWSMVAGALIIAGITSALSFWAFGWRRPRFCWDRAAIGELISFGKWVFFASLLGFFILNGDRFVIGKLQGLHAVGIYSIAFTWSSALHQMFYLFLSRLYLPVVAQFKRLGSDAVDARRLRYLILSAMVIPYALLAGTSEQLIAFLYPENFLGAGIVMGLLVVGAWFSALEFIYNEQLMLEGKPAWRSFAQILSMAAIGFGLVLFASQSTLLIIAAIFVFGIMVRALILMAANDRSDLRSILPDLAITLLFIALCLAVRSAAGVIAASYTPFVALIVCAGALAPFGAVIGWFAIKRALALAAQISPELPISQGVIASTQTIA